MPTRKEKQPRIERTDDWQTIKQRTLWPEQKTYELIRPVVLFSETPGERAKETYEVKRTLYRQVERFEEQDLHRSIPTAIRLAVVELKTEFPFLHFREIANVCFVRYGRRPSHHTVQSILAENPPRKRKTRRYPPYAEIADPAERRLAVVRLHTEGLRITSIAEYLETTRQTVYAVLKRWIEEGVKGLEDKSHAPKHPKRKITLDAMNEVRKLQ